MLPQKKTGPNHIAARLSKGPGLFQHGGNKSIGKLLGIVLSVPLVIVADQPSVCLSWFNVQCISHRPSLKLDSVAQQQASPGEKCSPWPPTHGVMIEQLPREAENDNGFSVYHSSSFVAQLSILRVAIVKMAQVAFS